MKRNKLARLATLLGFLVAVNPFTAVLMPAATAQDAGALPDPEWVAGSGGGGDSVPYDLRGMCGSIELIVPVQNIFGDTLVDYGQYLRGCFDSFGFLTSDFRQISPRVVAPSWRFNGDTEATVLKRAEGGVYSNAQGHFSGLCLFSFGCLQEKLVTNRQLVTFQGFAWAYDY